MNNFLAKLRDALALAKLAGVGHQVAPKEVEPLTELLDDYERHKRALEFASADYERMAWSGEGTTVKCSKDRRISRWLEEANDAR